jgi:anti-repressor protein
MNKLIKIQYLKGKKAVSARELYDKLRFDSTHWVRWYKKNILKNPFAIEKEDWIGFAIEANGNEKQDFALSIRFAKKLSMLARTKEGEKVRDYFIEVEKIAKETMKKPQLPTSTIDILEMTIKGLREQQSELVEIKDEIRELKAATKTSPDYYTIVGWATLNNMNVGLKQTSCLGERLQHCAIKTAI